MRALIILACLMAPHVARADDCPGIVVGGVCILPAPDCDRESILTGAHLVRKGDDGVLALAPWCDGLVVTFGGQAKLIRDKDTAVRERDKAIAERDDAIRQRVAENEEHARVEAAKDKQIADCERSKTPTCPKPVEKMSAWEGGLIGGAIVTLIAGAVGLILAVK